MPGGKTSTRINIRMKKLRLEALHNNPSFCVYPWMHQMVDPSGDLRLCCSASTSMGTYETIKEDWNSSEMQEVRRDMIMGKPIKGCQRCYDHEGYGVVSSRQRAAMRYGHRPAFHENFKYSVENDMKVESAPFYIDVRFGNLCNLVCKMCDPWSSTQIIKDRTKLKKLDPDGYAEQIGDSAEYQVMDWYKDENFWDIMEEYLPHIREIYLTGGEPTLIEENIQFLQRCIDLGYAKTISLSFNSNMTNINQNLIDVCKQFQYVGFSASIDGTGLIDEYIRYPSKWSKIKENLIKLWDVAREPDGDFFISINLVVQAYNILSLPDIFSELIELDREYGRPSGAPIKIDLNLLTYPPRFAINNLPDPIKWAAKTRLEGWMKRNPELEENFWNEGWTLIEGAIDLLEGKPTAPISAESQLQYAKFHDQNKPISLETHLPLLYRYLESAFRAEQYQKSLDDQHKKQ